MRTQQEFVHLATVDEYLTLLVQRHARHLADEVAQHGTLWQLEGRGIIDERVAMPKELYLCGRHHHFLHRLALHLTHAQGGDLHLLLPGRNGHALPLVIVAVELGTDEVLHR